MSSASILSQLAALRARQDAAARRLDDLEARVGGVAERAERSAADRERDTQAAIERSVEQHMGLLQDEMTRHFRSDVDILQTKIEHTVNSKISEALLTDPGSEACDR